MVRNSFNLEIRFETSEALEFSPRTMHPDNKSFHLWPRLLIPRCSRMAERNACKVPTESVIGTTSSICRMPFFFYWKASKSDDKKWRNLRFFFTSSRWISLHTFNLKAEVFILKKSERKINGASQILLLVNDESSYSLNKTTYFSTMKSTVH